MVQEWLIVLPAAISNIGTVLCLKKAKFAVVNGDPVVGWLAGVALTIVVAQFLMCWADVRGASLGLVMSGIIVLVMLTAVLIDVQGPGGALTLLSPSGLPILESSGYGLAVAGIFMVGISKSMA